MNLAIFTSETDDATKVAFPLGRRVSTLFEKTQSGMQAKANVTAIGHFTPYITHDLIATGEKEPTKESKRLKEPSADEMEKSSERVVQLRSQNRRNTAEKRTAAEDFAYHFVGSDLKPRFGYDPRMPLYVVSVDTRIIPDHSGINRAAFLRFLRQFITTFEPQDR